MKSVRSFGAVGVCVLVGLVACSATPSADDVLLPPPSDDGGPTPTLDAATTSDAGPQPDGAPPNDAAAKPECTKPTDCASGICTAENKCAAATATDGVKNGDETDIDCGGASAPKCPVPFHCKVSADCTTNRCVSTSGVLRCENPPTPTDGLKNGTETDIDCGGVGNPKCANAKACLLDDDCTSTYCKAKVCTMPAVGDGVQNGTETDIDCGGPGALRCDDALKCLVGDDCKSKVCTDLADGNGKRCQAPTSTDGAQNGTETDVDCGGSAPACGTTKKCNAGTDCTSKVCQDLGAGSRCQAPSPTDGVMNGDESDVDCGGVAAGAARCNDLLSCFAASDCKSKVCTDVGDGNGLRCQIPTPTDGVQNGTETDTDCGGLAAPQCIDTKKCLVGGDCTSKVCKDLGAGKKCQVPSPTDGVLNGTETDLDCGGGGANPGCAAGKNCALPADCASLGCYMSKCAVSRSCTTHFGGDTCGLGGAGGVGAEAWESCCAQASVTPTAGPTVGVPIMLGKYAVTSGRIRVFMESIGYDVRAYVRAARLAGKIPLIPGDATHRVLDPAWDLYLPTSLLGDTAAGELSDCEQADTTTPVGTTCKPGTEQPGIYTSVARHLGKTIFKANAQTTTGCGLNQGLGTHAFRLPDGTEGADVAELDQDTYDTKAMQCIDYLVAQAFCVWDGGRLQLFQEWQAAWGAATMPWDAMTTQVPAEPNQRTNGVACTAATVVTDCGNTSMWTCTAGKCTINGSADSTDWHCRFPWVTDANHAGCALSWPATTSIEYADYKYSYEWPKRISQDAIVFIAAPGRTRGRGPAGHADIIGTNFSLTSNVTFNTDPFVARHGWNGSGSWEVHSYSKATSVGSSPLLNKYGKLGLRCAYP